ncbi:HTH-type transcriptional activator CmpR [Andreprevotia sp. IGB-42]|uniref:LysR substrate-binding domain-containing protein n=1 Tax=Andreprevotia sp. IGB-42 TaxID=2497473 RepID=UPI001358AD65|nr:LysR substrate-binding domain-containing protein [Andreprevotia sp. IGB-42]KAF0813703.1 HTH-type transcriptional activator CmpR [Andreprevotia sp. IGB-42]
MLPILLKTFLEVARQGGVTAAARRLKLSQPTVSAQLRQLEAAYQVELFQRRAGRLVMTDAAIALLPGVERLQQQEAELDFMLRNASHAQAGTLRLAATGPFYLLPQVAAFRRAYPAMEVALEFGNSRHVIEALGEYRVDLAVSSQRLDDHLLARWTLASSPLVLVVNRAHPLACADEINLAELATATLLLREAGSVTRQVAEAALATGGVTPQAMLELGSREAIREAVAHGLGCTIMAAGEVSPHPQLRTVRLRDCAATIDEYLYCLDARRSFRPISLFVETALAGQKPGQ